MLDWNELIRLLKMQYVMRVSESQFSTRLAVALPDQSKTLKSVAAKPSVRKCLPRICADPQ